MPDDALTRERVREALAEGAEWCELMSDTASRDQSAVLRDLLTALDDPARWCGVVGDVFEVHSDTMHYVEPGDLVVTPHQEGA